MKKIWKWIIGIVAGLLALALLVGAGCLVRMRSLGYGVRIHQGFNREGFGMMPYGGMHGGFGIMPFGGLFGGLVSLGILALIVLGIIWLVRNLRGSTAESVPVAPATPAALSKKCGQPVETTWHNCPYCGRKL